MWLGGAGAACVRWPHAGPPAALPLPAASKRQQERAEREAARAEREANRIELDETDEAMVVPTDADRDFIDDEVRCRHLVVVQPACCFVHKHVHDTWASAWGHQLSCHQCTSCEFIAPAALHPRACALPLNPAIPRIAPCPTSCQGVDPDARVDFDDDDEQARSGSVALHPDLMFFACTARAQCHGKPSTSPPLQLAGYEEAEEAGEEEDELERIFRSARLPATCQSPSPSAIAVRHVGCSWYLLAPGMAWQRA